MNLAVGSLVDSRQHKQVCHIFRYEGPFCLFIDCRGGNRKTPGECCAWMCTHSCWARTEAATHQRVISLCRESPARPISGWNSIFGSSGEIKKLRFGSSNPTHLPNKYRVWCCCSVRKRTSCQQIWEHLGAILGSSI